VVSRPHLNGGATDRADVDRVLPFTLPGRGARGRVARLGPTLRQILAAHDYPPILARLLGEALVLTALIGTTLQKDLGQTTLQAQAKGPVDLLVCDYRGGELRGYLRVAPDAHLVPGMTVGDLFGEGYLAVTIDQLVAADRYQGIVPLEGRCLSEAVERYFSVSEQVPTLIRAAVEQNDTADWIGGGLLVQQVSRGEVGTQRLTAVADEADWQHVDTLARTIRADELTDPALDEETILWRLFNEDEIRVSEATRLIRGCRCSPDHIRDVLSRFPVEDRDAMRDETGKITVDCAFCARRFPVEL
jgi:molecular chaperone Hsp33